VLASATLVAFTLSLGGRLLAENFLTTRIPIIGDFTGLSPVANSGIAFGITFTSPLLTILVGAALLLVCVLAWKSRRERIPALSFGLILGGGLANIVDRIGDGLVTDFFQIGSFPVFNVADSCITIGVGILLSWELLRKHRANFQ